MKSLLPFFAVITIPIILFCAEEAAQPTADISGEWTGAIPAQFTGGRDGEKIIFTLQAKEGGLTGSIVAFQSESEITDGKIIKKKISFKSKLLPSGQSIEFSFKGEIISNDSLDLEMKGNFFPDAQTIVYQGRVGSAAPVRGSSGAIKLKRSK
jgi:hypothetical protein